MTENDKIVKCEKSTVQLRTDGILYIKIKGHAAFEIKDIHELIAAAHLLGKGMKFKNLILVEGRSIPTKEARELSVSKEGSIYKLADAFVIKSLAQSLIGNFMTKVQEPAVPTKFFNNEEDAMKWLNSLSVG